MSNPSAAPAATPDTTDSIMLDIESLGLGPNAGLIQIGAVAFDSKTGKPRSDEFEVDVDLLSALMAGGEVDDSTVRWWREQKGPKLARPKDIRGALCDLSSWIKKFPGVTRVWAQGPSFDIAVLEGYYKRLGLPIPWKYNAARDTRTVYDLAQETGWKKPAGSEPVHTGMEDCRRQIVALSSALATIRDRGSLGA